MEEEATEKGSHLWSDSSLSSSSKTPAFGNDTDIFFVGRLEGEQGLPACRGRHLLELCFGLSLRLKTAKSCVSPRRRSLQVLEMACKLGPGQPQTGKTRYRTEGVKEALEILIAKKA